MKEFARCVFFGLTLGNTFMFFVNGNSEAWLVTEVIWITFFCLFLSIEDLIDD